VTPTDCLPDDLSAALVQRAASRPALGDGVYTLDSADGAFRLHYTLEGADALRGVEDENGDGVADVAVEILSGLERARGLYQSWGWPDVVGDDGGGGTDAIDVYVHAIDGNGFAYPTTPNDARVESTCHISLNNDLTDGDGAILRSVAGHELHHCLQFGYTVGLHSWLYESGATWAQYRLEESEALTLALDALYIIRLLSPDDPVATTDGRFEYAGFFFWKFWTERRADGLGGPADDALAVSAWEDLRGEGGWVVRMDEASDARFGQPFAATYAEWSAWNLFACARDDGQHYAATPLPCGADIESPLVETAGPELTFEALEGRFTTQAAAVSLRGDDAGALLDCALVDPGEESEAWVSLAAVDADGALISRVLGQVGEGTLKIPGPLDPGGALWVTFSDTGKDQSGGLCVLEREVTKEGGCATSPRSSGWLWVAGVLTFCLRRRRAPFALS
jgi:hypothetical protein